MQKILTNIVSAELVGGRHQSAKYKTDLSIFASPVSEFLMANFDAQEDVVNDFINKYHVEKLVLYATGIQSCLASVIKVCMKRDIPLTIMHWKAATKEFLHQDMGIVGDMPNAKYNCFRCLADSRDIYVNGNIDTSIGTNLVSINCGKKIGDKIIAVATIFSDKIDWALYGTLVEEIKAVKGTDLAIFMDNCTIESDSFIRFNDNIAKSFNS